MNDDHPTRRTIEFLAERTVDGSLSGTEIWELANFLNTNKECREHWPGSLLFPLLSDAYADGGLSTDEMKLAAQTIANIEREWAWRWETGNMPGERLSLGGTISLENSSISVKTRPVAEYDPGAAFNALKQQPTGVKKHSSLVEENGKKSYLLKPLKQYSSIPRLPTVKCKMIIQSHSESGGEYEVDLNEHTCTCADWASARYLAEVGAVNRACKHIAEAFLKLKEPLPEWLSAVFEECVRRNRGTRPEDEWFILQLSKKNATAIAGSSNPWVNVYSPSEGLYERFGYNKEEDRWSYARKPRLSRRIAEFIGMHF
jgi:hypothetical protein